MADNLFGGPVVTVLCGDYASKDQSYRRTIMLWGEQVRKRALPDICFEGKINRPLQLVPHPLSTRLRDDAYTFSLLCMRIANVLCADCAYIKQTTDKSKPKGATTIAHAAGTYS